MKESTGSVSAIYVVIFFVIIIFGFIISTLSYYKSYKINNSLTAAIEDYGGFNNLSKEEIERRLTTYGYTRSNISCRVGHDDFTNNVRLVKSDGTIIDEEGTFDSNDLGYKGYCVYVVDDTPDAKDDEIKINNEYYSYKVTTSMTLDFGLFDFNIPIRMSTHTSTMYSCFNKQLNYDVKKNNC